MSFWSCRVWPSSMSFLGSGSDLDRSVILVLDIARFLENSVQSQVVRMGV